MTRSIPMEGERDEGMKGRRNSNGCAPSSLSPYVPSSLCSFLIAGAEP